MNTASLQGLALITVGATLLSVPTQHDPNGPAKFAAPVRIEAGDAFLGAQRLYPSPHFRDMNGDGLADVVIGDLPGRVTVAYAEQTQDGRISFHSEKPLKDRRGEALKFHNW